MLSLEEANAARTGVVEEEEEGACTCMRIEKRERREAEKKVKERQEERTDEKR